jgi:DNA repair protein RecN
MKYALILSILLYVFGCFYLVFGIYALFANVKNRVNRFFYYLTSCLAIFAISYSISNSAATEEASTFWRAFAVFGWGVYYSILIHIILIITDELLAVSQSMMNCYYILKDNFSQLKDISDQFYFDEETYDGIIKKLELFKKLSYKYGTTVEEITAFRQDAEKQLHDIDNFDNIYKEKIQRIEKLSELLYEKGELLNGLRVKAAEHFSKSVETNLHSLEMPDAVFNVHFEKNLKKNTLGYYDFNRKGLYDIEFLISVNKGIDPLPMAKIASGGEISRIMLAIKCIISNNDDIETYIFDEIDSGVSGEAAIMTANKLYELSASKQVISITHLPQIAAKADHHYLISKYSDEDSTYADIKKLTHNERINQLAILFDGKKVSQEGLEYAKNLLDKMKESDSIRVALREVQEGFIGEAERLGLKTEADVVETVKQFRKEKREK